MNDTDTKPEARVLRRLSVAPAPHIATRDSTTSLMLDVLIALVPALVSAVWFFGPRALALVGVTAAAAVGFEALYRRLSKQSMTVGDLSAAVTGVLLAMSLPVETPYWVAVLGAAFAILVVKQLFGGLGQNFVNPALMARAFLLVSFPAILGKFVSPGFPSWAPLVGSAGGAFAADAVSAATPLAALRAGTLPGLTLQQLFVGQQPGCLGETASLMLLLGGVYLVVRRVITPRVPFYYLATVALLTWLFPLGGVPRTQWMLCQLLSGGLMLGALFMAPDYATSPATPWGQRIYAVGCGVLTVLLRYFGGRPEGVSFAILLMNVLSWPLDMALPWLRRRLARLPARPAAPSGDSAPDSSSPHDP